MAAPTNTIKSTICGAVVPVEAELAAPFPILETGLSAFSSSVDDVPPTAVVVVVLTMVLGASSGMGIRISGVSSNSGTVGDMENE